MSKCQTDFIGDELIHKIPANPVGRTFIYALMDDEENILYIGQSKKPVFRIAAHVRKKTFTKYKFFECDPAQVNQIEFALYEKYSPGLNRAPPLDNTYCNVSLQEVLNRCWYMPDSDVILAYNTLKANGSIEEVVQ